MNEKDRVDQIIPKLSVAQLDGLHLVSRSRLHEVDEKVLDRIEGLGLVRTSGVHGAGKPTSGWCTALGDAVLARLAGETHE